MASDALAPLNALVSDMTTPSETRPHGLTADWAARPRLMIGNDPGKYGFSQILGWGVAYEAATGNAATNTRVEVNDIQLWVMSKSTGQWSLMQSSVPNGIAGGMFAENFAADVNEVASTRREADGGISATPGHGLDWHFWGRDVPLAIKAADIGGVVMSYDARLVVDDPSKADDRGSAKYVAAAGTDYWNATMTANGDAGIGRFKLVTTDYRTFTMSTLDADALAANPPAAYLKAEGLGVVRHSTWDDYVDPSGRLAAQVFRGADDAVLKTATFTPIAAGTLMHVEVRTNDPYAFYDKYLDRSGAVKAIFFYEDDGSVHHSVAASTATAASDAAFADGLYVDVFGRHLKTGEASYFADRFAHGASRADVADEVARIAGSYHHAAGHLPDLLL